MKKNQKILVKNINCGYQCKHRLFTMGIVEGTELEIISVQPINGPYTVKVGNSEITIGRGMFDKIDYEVI